MFKKSFSLFLTMSVVLMACSMSHAGDIIIDDFSSPTPIDTYTLGPGVPDFC